jgi:hypothetical protein
MLGFVVIVDASSPESLADARGMIEFFTARSDVPFVLAVNKVDADDESAIEQVRAELRAGEAPLVAVDARDRESVKSVLLALLYEIVETAA